MELINEIRGIIFKEGLNLKKASDMAGLNSNSTTTKFRTGTLRVSEMEKLLSVAGYQVKFEKIDNIDYKR